jgi:hypothetical protein
MPVFCVVGAGPDEGSSGSGSQKTNSHSTIYEKVLSNMNEVFTRKGKIITVTDRDGIQTL